jgi:hypothetical protein
MHWPDLKFPPVNLYTLPAYAPIETKMISEKKLLTGDVLGVVLKEALGLPERTMGLEIRVYPGEPVKIRCEYYPGLDKDEISKLFAEYNLVEISR